MLDWQLVTGADSWQPSRHDNLIKPNGTPADMHIGAHRATSMGHGDQRCCAWVVILLRPLVESSKQVSELPALKISLFVPPTRSRLGK